MLIPDDDFKGLFAGDDDGYEDLPASDEAIAEDRAAIHKLATDLERAKLERERAAERDVFVRLYLLSVHGTEGTWN